MKKLLLFMFAVVAFAACEQAPVEEQSVIRQEAPDTITVGFEGDETRIQLNEAQKTVWTKGDLVSVFYKSDANQKYEYRGETGERTAELHKVSAGSSTTKMGYVVVAYPYNEEYIISPASGNLETMLPAVQHYAVDSYGVGDNLMVSCSEFTQFSLKSVCGWLKLQLTGNGEVVKGIKFRGNNGEQVAGLIHVDTKSAEATLYSEEVAPDDNGNANGSLVIDGAMATEVMLYCDEGVTLSSEATAFYIALPPQTFEEGFTVDIECDGYKPMTLSTTNTLTIERNHIQPMAATEFVASVPNNQIWYTSSDGNVVEPYDTNVFGANIVSNTYANGMGVITFDGDVTTIGYGAFVGCDSLTSVTIPDSVTTIGDYAFASCDSLTEFKGKFASEDGRSLIVDNTIIAYAKASGTTYTIPDSVTTIGFQAFGGCTSLTSVTIPDSVTTIGDYAFFNSDSLTSVTIGDSVTSIGSYAFSECDSLTSVTIPDSVTTIDCWAFYNCDSLTSVTIPDSVTTIGWEAFAYCDSLTSVIIGDSVTMIRENAFYGCKSLTSVTIPDSVTSIGTNAFYSCNSLTSVYCKATTPPALGYSNVFDYYVSGRKIYVPTESVNAYKSAYGWSEYASAIVGYDF